MSCAHASVHNISKLLRDAFAKDRLHLHKTSEASSMHAVSTENPPQHARCSHTPSWTLRWGASRCQPWRTSSRSASSSRHAQERPSSQHGYPDPHAHTHKSDFVCSLLVLRVSASSLNSQLLSSYRRQPCSSAANINSNPKLQTRR
jgi:hypothetical protein